MKNIIIVAVCVAAFFPLLGVGLSVMIWTAETVSCVVHPDYYRCDWDRNKP